MTEPSAPLKSVFVTTVAASSVAVIYGLVGVQPSPLPTLFLTFAPLISVIFWVQSDARFHRLATKIGRASCRERVEISARVGALEKKSARTHSARPTPSG